MAFKSLYWMAMSGIAALLVMTLVQWLVATLSKGAQPGAIPGKIDPSLSHGSFVFRAHRTFMNTLENLPVMLGCAFLAILLEATPFWTGVFIWVFVLARLMHMALYYAIATEDNPSPRSYFFLMGFLANIALMVLCLTTLADI